MKKNKSAPLKAKPEPLVFEHAPVERPYDRIANRVLKAVQELNGALKEAHECAEMRVFLMSRKADGEAMQFEPQIYQMTHSTLTYVVTFKEDEPKMAWRHVKDPAFKDAAGQAWGALNKKSA